MRTVRRPVALPFLGEQKPGKDSPGEAGAAPDSSTIEIRGASLQGAAILCPARRG